MALMAMSADFILWTGTVNLYSFEVNGGMKHRIDSPMMGSVACVYCETGAVVAADEVILQIECLKIFFDVVSPVAGTVQLLVKPGMQVAQDQWIASVVDSQ